ncbi:hypothetical protein [Leptolyngbya sp. FACHB-321]|nr:hypothetical protein [Leptolyngbya sp. FACHB-321]
MQRRHKVNSDRSSSHKNCDRSTFWGDHMTMRDDFTGVFMTIR